MNQPFARASVSDIANVRRMIDSMRVSVNHSPKGGGSVGNAAMMQAGRRGGGAVGLGGCGFSPAMWDQGFGNLTAGGPTFNPIAALAQVHPQAALAALSQMGANSPNAGGNVGADPNSVLAALMNQQPEMAGCFPPAQLQNYCQLYPQARGLQRVEFAVNPGLLAAASTLAVTINPPVAIQIEDIRFPSDTAGDLALSVFTSGIQQLTLGGRIPARLGTEVSICGIKIAKTTIIPGVGATVNLTNTNAPGGQSVDGTFVLTVVAAYC